MFSISVFHITFGAVGGQFLGCYGQHKKSSLIAKVGGDLSILIHRMRVKEKLEALVALRVGVGVGLWGEEKGRSLIETLSLLKSWVLVLMTHKRLGPR